mmetsp:Transcript_42315/g.165209  ORF Transcript_42315/g.165209 Transcript_42315/m.165209 type:complete len:311 (+) Transcript_42315:746-1678(+)
MYNSYREYSEPLLKAAAKLQDHLYIIGRRKATGKKVLDNPKYTAYLLGRFFCYVEVFKQLSPSMAFGKPRRDRIFSNILGRIQVILAMDNSELVQLYGGDNCSSNIENPFKIPSQEQASLGQLMLRERWLEYNFRGGSPHKTSSYAHSGVHFPEFTELLEENSEFSRWFGPLVEALNPDHVIGASDSQNLRLGLFQTALVDLVDFLDPAPMCTIIPAYRRRRLYTPPRMVHTKLPQTLAYVPERKCKRHCHALTKNGRLLLSASCVQKYILRGSRPERWYAAAISWSSEYSGRFRVWSNWSGFHISYKSE